MADIPTPQDQHSDDGGAPLGFTPRNTSLFFVGAIAFCIIAVIILAAGLSLISSGRHTSSVWQLVLGGLICALAVSLAIWAIWLGHRGMHRLLVTPIAGLPEVTGPLPQLTTPAPVADVVAALEVINHEDLPYRIDFSQGEHGQTIATIRFRVEETRWKNFFGTGSVKRTWVLRIKLKRQGHFTWSEKTGIVTQNASLAQAAFSYQRSMFMGKSLTAGSVTHVWEPGQHAKQRMRTTDVKIPVFTILRSYGWRPRWDWWGVRMWEY